MMPSFTFVATAVAVERCGFRPYLVDVDPIDWQISADTVASHPRLDEVGLVVPVAAFGRAVPQAPWRRFHEATGIPVVIDGGASFEAMIAAPAPHVGGLPVALSFHATKSFATAEGGCVVIADRQAAAAVTRALNFGFHETRDSRAASTNGKMSEYHAAIGLAELDGWSEKHTAIGCVADMYRCAAAKQGIADRLIVAPDVAGCYALFVGGDARELDRVRASLEQSRIDVRAWYGLGVHEQPHFHDAARDQLHVTDRIAPFVVGLPTAPDLSATAVDRITAALAAGIDARR
jgi:dTDP-4-amino-4,6-dideoxygalactose transaminase